MGSIVLNEVHVAGVASYPVTGEKLLGLKRVNYIFGTNGSGKTTLSRVIRAPGSYPTCALTWASGRVVEALVFNGDYAAETFRSSTTPGIFTLGQENDDIRNQIAEAKKTVDDLQIKIVGMEKNLVGEDRASGKVGELKALRSALDDAVWKYKQDHDDDFAEAYRGLRTNKILFCDKMLEHHGSNTSALHTFDTLKERAKTVFDKSIGILPETPAVDFRDLQALHADPILAKKVIGKEDVDVAAIITQLGNSDWVKSGLSFVAAPGEPCPFCQQTTPPDLIQRLNDYFDETFLADMRAIERIEQTYSTFSQTVLNRLATIIPADHRYLDTTLFEAEFDRLKDRLTLNASIIEGKRKEPSAPVALEDIVEVATAITALLDDARTKTRAHNQTVENLDNERTTLISEIWRCIVNDAKAILDAYIASKIALDSAVTGLTNGIAKWREEQKEVRSTLQALEKSVTSVQPTVDQINATLASFGFKNFKLATAGSDDDLYRIIRSDGTDAYSTLSEGEKGFITFLYFYHRIRGNVTQSDINTDRIVVFDDPVSSLDSDVLFVVSALIKRLAVEAAIGVGQVKQVFILTHNIYFHKEVSFNPNRDLKVCLAHETFWIVKKSDAGTKLVSFPANPIKSSYELLWEEVRSENRSKSTIQNTLRRILENYFKILGSMDFKDIAERFEGRDQIIYGSLISWLHDGSHSLADDLHLSTDDNVIDQYLAVFKRIFDETGHGAHYRMMMGTPEVAGAANQNDGPNGPGMVA